MVFLVEGFIFLCILLLWGLFQVRMEKVMIELIGDRSWGVMYEV